MSTRSAHNAPIPAAPSNLTAASFAACTPKLAAFAASTSSPTSLPAKHASNVAPSTVPTALATANPL